LLVVVAIIVAYLLAYLNGPSAIVMDVVAAPLTGWAFVSVPARAIGFRCRRAADG
jgi:hypothetical protein